MSKAGEIIEEIISQLSDVQRLFASKLGIGFSALECQLVNEIIGEAQLIKDNSLPPEIWAIDVQEKLVGFARQLGKIMEGITVCSQGKALEQMLQMIQRHISVLSAQVILPLCRSSAINNSLPTDLMPLLDLTRRSKVVEIYEKMNPTLKGCLLTIVIFPQDSIIEKRLLIHWWVGENLITRTRIDTADELGDVYIKKLIHEGLIMPVHKEHESSEVKSCRMKPWIREEVIILAMLDKAFSFNGSGELIEALTSSPRACLNESPQQQQGTILPATNDFRGNNFMTCFNVDRHNLRFEKSRFMEMRNAAVMQLGRWQTSPRHHVEAVSGELLEWLACFKKLRYLSLRGISNITKLPRSIGELTDLMILDLRACHNLESLPVEITQLEKLTYLDVSECYLLDRMPKGLSSLQELRVLKGFVVANSRCRDPCRVWELARLEKLRKLSIIIGMYAAGTNGELYQLGKCKTLQSLTVTWGGSGASNHTVEPSALERVRSVTAVMLSVPPPNLRKLDLRCFPGDRAPEWLVSHKLPNLRKLYVRGGNLRRFNQFGEGTELRFVQLLRLRFLKNFSMEGPALLRAFPGLVYLEIHECNKMKFIRSPRKFPKQIVEIPYPQVIERGGLTVSFRLAKNAASRLSGVI